MGDFDAKRLLAENSRLKDEQQELSSVLGEEKEMVKYLHGVIKNYEHLLRSNSKRQNRYRPVATRNMTETEIDPAVICSEIQARVPARSPHKTNKSNLLSDDVSEREEKGMTSLRSSLERRHDMHGLQTVEREVKQQFVHSKDSLSVQDDISLEDLECLSISSTEESTDESLVNQEMEHKQDRIQSNQDEKHLKTSRTLEETSRDVNQKQSDIYHQVNDFGHNVRKHTKRTFYDKEPSGITASSTGSHARPSTISTSLDTELDELNKELDRIAGRLNHYEKSINRSEKHLSKMEHRMEYLESFALGEESEYL